MSKLVLYYSYTGNSKKHADEFAKMNDTKLVEVKPIKKIGKFKAYTSFCLKARKGKSTPIEPFAGDLSDYNEIDVFAPVWASCIAPPMYAALGQLTKGTKVSLHLVSGSGRSNKELVTSHLVVLGLEVAKYEDLK